MRKNLVFLVPLAIAACLMILPAAALAHCGSCGTGGSNADHAGHGHDKHAGHGHGKDMAAQMEMMKAEMSKCHVCKVGIPYMDTLMPSMNMEVVGLDNGFAIIHNTSDPSKVATMHEFNNKMHKAGNACMAWSAEEASSKLCQHCSSMVSVLNSGAVMSNGNTSNGCIMIINSDDPSVQAKIAKLQKQFEAQLAMAN